MANNYDFYSTISENLLMMDMINKSTLVIHPTAVGNFRVGFHSTRPTVSRAPLGAHREASCK